ncbi:unnamed protein product [Ectocarpus sp. 12 AP-2014]
MPLPWPLPSRSPSSGAGGGGGGGGDAPAVAPLTASVMTATRQHSYRQQQRQRRNLLAENTADGGRETAGSRRAPSFRGGGGATFSGVDEDTSDENAAEPAPVAPPSPPPPPSHGGGGGGGGGAAAEAEAAAGPAASFSVPGFFTPRRSFTRRRAPLSPALSASPPAETRSLRSASASSIAGTPRRLSRGFRSASARGDSQLQVVMCSSCGRAGFVQSSEALSSRSTFFCSCGSPVVPASALQLLTAMPGETSMSSVAQHTGASPQQLVERLPTMQYQESSRKVLVAEHGEEDKVSCRVCLSDYEAGDTLRILPCLHKFHRECIDEWLGRSVLCPLCNTSVEVAEDSHVTCCGSSSSSETSETSASAASTFSRG